MSDFGGEIEIADATKHAQVLIRGGRLHGGRCMA
jgi:hypothetical protein